MGTEQKTYKLPQTGYEVEKLLKKIPNLEQASESNAKEIVDIKHNMPIKVSDLLNDSGYTTAKELADVEAVAKGRATGYVFETVDDMNEWLANPDNVAKLTLGDNFYIRDTSVPDYWWDGQAAQELETQKVNLDEYVKVEDGKGLSTNDFTDEHKEKIDAMEQTVTENQDRIIGLESVVSDVEGRIMNNEGDIATLYDEVYYDRERIDILENNMGDVETALDNIIAIQNSLIGGES